MSATFLQPFFARTTPTAWTYAVNLEATYNWEAEQWSVPLNVTVAKLIRWGSQLVQVGGGLRYWVETPNDGPEGLGVRIQMTFLFPK